LAEAFRNVAVTGATPVAVSDCLNFGSPENPEVMWQFSEAVEGLSDGCLELEIPVTGGNVSFYNQTGDEPIHPTPVVAVLGVIDDVAARIPSGWQDEGNNIYLLGTTRDELDGSAWAGVLHDHLGGHPPVVSFDDEKALAALISAGASESLISSAHDLTDGGLAQSLAECVLRFGIGARVWISEIMQRDGVDATAALFSESTGRVIVSVPREDDVKFVGLCEGRGFPFLRIGVTDSGGALEVQDQFTVSLGELQDAHRGTLPAAFGPVVDRPTRLRSPADQQHATRRPRQDGHQRRSGLMVAAGVVLALLLGGFFAVNALTLRDDAGEALSVDPVVATPDPSLPTASPEPAPPVAPDPAPVAPAPPQDVDDDDDDDDD